jgi:hypothetical protein
MGVELIPLYYNSVRFKNEQAIAKMFSAVTSTSHAANKHRF